MTSPEFGTSKPAVAEAEKKPAKMPVKRRLTLVAAVTGLVLLPAIIMVLVTWVSTGEVQGAATWASIPAIVGIAAAMAGGFRFAVIVSIVTAFLAPVMIVAGLSPVSGAALMAILCLTVGRLSRFGLQKSGLLVPVMLAWPLIDPPAWDGASSVDRLDNTYLLWMTLIFLVGGLVPALLLSWKLRKRPAPKLASHTRREAMTYTVMITILVTASTYYVLDNPKMIGGAFLIAVVLVMAPIGTSSTIKPTIFRLIGTVIGSVLVIALVSKVESLVVIYLIGLVFLWVALFARLSGQAWIYFIFMVPATACLNATTLSQVSELGKQRVIDNVVGGIAVIIATVLAIGYSQWSSRRGEATDTDHEIQIHEIQIRPHANS
jgi:MFS family permease